MRTWVRTVITFERCEGRPSQTTVTSGVDRLPASRAGGRAAPRLWARPQPRRARVGETQVERAGHTCPDTIDEATGYADDGLDRIGSDVDPCLAFLRHRGLKL